MLAIAVYGAVEVCPPTYIFSYLTAAKDATNPGLGMDAGYCGTTFEQYEKFEDSEVLDTEYLDSYLEDLIHDHCESYEYLATDHMDEDDYDEDEDDDFDFDEDELDEGFDFGDEETTIYEVTCACGNVIDFDEETLEAGSIVCPDCGEVLEFSLEDEDEE